MHVKRKATEAAGPHLAKRPKAPHSSQSSVLSTSASLKRPAAEDNIPHNPRIIKRMCLSNGRILNLVRFKLPNATTPPSSSAVIQTTQFSAACTSHVTPIATSSGLLPSTSVTPDVVSVRRPAAQPKRKGIPLNDEVPIEMLVYGLR